MKARSWMGCVALTALVTSGSALAAWDASQVADKLNFDEERTRVGLDVRVGAGGFTGDLGESTAPGPVLGIIAGARPWRAVGVEAGFEGQRLPLDDARVGDEQAMYRYNLGVLAKAGPLLFRDKVRPFVGAGVGVSYLNATDEADTLYGNDFVAEVPLAVGVEYQFNQNIFAGARGTYRVLIDDEFADLARPEDDPSGGLLNFGLTLGGRF